ncbi:MAG: ribonuclease III [Casimicrobiaceae bacterium]|nr:ribonuclease III [Casimicrobiaceae bacterium]MCX8099093.1 ribonuclease III [Casimicrobiaceae bacterium]MDW8312371.1 ribonuclease III [Burkholderiales bacterium]
MSLESELGYVFIEPKRLTEALTHRSFGQPHNERLEFIGDSVLNCVIALALFERFPALPEGQLSRIRANLVSQPTLHALALRLDLPQHLRIGEGEEKSGGRERPSMLADALEAIIGAIALDGGFEAAHRVVLRLYEHRLAAIDPREGGKDPKTRLQEYLQGRHLPLPVYRVERIEGEAHAQLFTVRCSVTSLGHETQGRGSSRRAAEQQAAEALLKLLGQ